jgi:uncharacterized phage protein (TIGR01671 family)
MTRENKFKGWDTKRNKMYSASEMGNDELTINPDGRGFVNVSSTDQKISQYMPYIIPLQFIGLLDKNKNEIYEGDILKYSFQTKQMICFPYTERINPGWELWEIKYIAPSFVYIIHSQSNSCYGELPAKPCVISLHYLHAVEIIGNIYENPELLSR